MAVYIFLLIWGAIELVVGGIVSTKKRLIIIRGIVESFSYLNINFSIDKIKDIKRFSKWIGEVILVEGALYIFLASASIYFKMNVLIVLIFISIIEVLFFNIVNRGLENYIEK
ncbi:hypothetical protein H9660_12295 [Clostridium sp. Sa3CUN1]|uniref:Uncharacterized protein n=1 Tax=Clostridium gallinarum TaxID=2762246 RepID=A0ABR8Q673_9CLOT|nr:hypothetical protein [Clostridium gallinarum]MBD7915926.1 hypothetical protein [Clostridium gallinarum]